MCDAIDSPSRTFIRICSRLKPCALTDSRVYGPIGGGIVYIESFSTMFVARDHLCTFVGLLSETKFLIISKKSVKSTSGCISPTHYHHPSLLRDCMVRSVRKRSSYRLAFRLNSASRSLSVQEVATVFERQYYDVFGSTHVALVQVVMCDRDVLALEVVEGLFHSQYQEQNQRQGTYANRV